MCIKLGLLHLLPLHVAQKGFGFFELPLRVSMLFDTSSTEPQTFQLHLHPQSSIHQTVLFVDSIEGSRQVYHYTKEILSSDPRNVSRYSNTRNNPNSRSSRSVSCLTRIDMLVKIVSDIEDVCKSLFHVVQMSDWP